MTDVTMQRAELEALIDELLHACLGAPEDELRGPYDESCRAFAELPLCTKDRVWIDSELRRIGSHFDLR